MPELNESAVTAAVDEALTAIAAAVTSADLKAARIASTGESSALARLNATWAGVSAATSISLSAGLKPSAVALATRESVSVVKGMTSDSDRLLDAYIFVGSRKVFYRSNRTG